MSFVLIRPDEFGLRQDVRELLVLARLEACCEVDLPDQPLTNNALQRKVEDKDALVCVLTDSVNATVLEAGWAGVSY